MKKAYIAPRVQMTSVRMTTLIAASDSVNSEYMTGVTYGGVDENGEETPSSRRRSVWEEDDDADVHD